MKQLDLFQQSDVTSLSLETCLSLAFAVFDRLHTAGLQYAINFSGGKDSHALLGTYVRWHQVTGKSLDVIVVFSDTRLEADSLYKTVDRVAQWCDSIGLQFVRVEPVRSFWEIQFCWGYPVPDWKMRWCTKVLKTRPIEGIKRIALTGAHYGESANRDMSLNAREKRGCGSNECGSDLIENRVDPIKEFRNCQVWDWIAECEIVHHALPDGTLNNLRETYLVAQDENGSTRMGCEICPVIARSTLEEKVQKGISSEIGLQVRDIIDTLIDAPRLESPKKQGGHGAIHIEARISAWEKLKPLLPEMLNLKLITQQEISIVEAGLAARSYPPSYSLEWIGANEPFARTETEVLAAKKAEKSRQKNQMDLF